MINRECTKKKKKKETLHFHLFFTTTYTAYHVTFWELNFSLISESLYMRYKLDLTLANY